MARLPQVSGRRLIGMLESLGYVVVRRRGSHVRLTKATSAGEHHVTVPDHRTIAKGTLTDILSAVSIRTAISRNDLIVRLRS